MWLRQKRTLKYGKGCVA